MPPELPLQESPAPLTSRYVAAGIGVFLVLVAGASWVLFTRANTPQEKAPLRTVLIVRNPPSLDIVFEHANIALEELGYRAGSTIKYTEIEIGRDLASTKERIRPLLESGSVELVYAMGIIATRASKEVSQELGLDVPIVFAVVSDPVGSGLVASLQNSGNNLTGVTPTNEFAASKRLEFLAGA